MRKTADFFTATDGSEEKRTIYDIKFDKFISSGAVVEIHGCESGGDLYLVDSIVKNLSEEITDGYIVRHISKANPNIDGTKENKKQDYKHGLRAVWYNGKEIRKTTQERWIDFEELLK